MHLEPDPLPPAATWPEPSAAHYLGIGYQTLQRIRKAGTGPRFIRLSAQRIGYRQIDLDAWLGDRASTAPHAAKQAA